MKKTILVVSQYFYPEPFRINDICKEWVEQGYTVYVLTGIPNYPQGKFYDGYGLFRKRKEVYEGINIIRIPIVPRGKKAITLAFNYFSFVVSGFFWLLFTSIRPDLVFIFEVSPMTQALPGVWLSQKRGIPCYIYVQDLWPENVEIIAGIKNKTVLNQIGKMVDYIYDHCNLIFTTSKSFVQSIIDRGVAPQKVKYWPQYAEDIYMPNTSDVFPMIDTEKFNITFTGNVGEGQGLDVLVEAAAILSRNNVKHVIFNIVGDGRYKAKLMEKIESQNLLNFFNFIPRQNASVIPTILGSSDLAFLSLNKNPVFSKTIPAKLQTYLACGKPILAVAEGETKQIIKESQSGLCVSPGNSTELVGAIETLMNLTAKEMKQMADNALRYSDNNFNKDRLMKKMNDYITV